MTMDTLCTTVKGLNPCYVVAAAVAQYLFGMIWFNFIVRHIHCYYYATDKGVRRPEHAVHRYPKCVIAAINLLCCAARAAVVLTIVATYNATTLCDYQCAAAAAAAVMSIGAFKYFADQRPFQLIVTEGGYEVAATMIAAVVAFCMKQYGM